VSTGWTNARGAFPGSVVGKTDHRPLLAADDGDAGATPNEVPRIKTAIANQHRCDLLGAAKGLSLLLMCGLMMIDSGLTAVAGPPPELRR
jgi:hypothetical protein